MNRFLGSLSASEAIERYGTPTEKFPVRLATAKGEWWRTDKQALVHKCDDLMESDPPFIPARAYKNGYYCPACNARLTRQID